MTEPVDVSQATRDAVADHLIALKALRPGEDQAYRNGGKDQAPLVQMVERVRLAAEAPLRAQLAAQAARIAMLEPALEQSRKLSSAFIAFHNHDRNTERMGAALDDLLADAIKANSTARAALAPVGEPATDEARIAELEGAVNDGMSTLLAVRATASSDEWPDAAQHFFDLCGKTIWRMNAILGERHD